MDLGTEIGGNELAVDRTDAHTIVARCPPSSIRKTWNLNPLSRSLCVLRKRLEPLIAASSVVKAPSSIMKPSSTTVTAGGSTATSISCFSMTTGTVVTVGTEGGCDVIASTGSWALVAPLIVTVEDDEDAAAVVGLISW